MKPNPSLDAAITHLRKQRWNCRKIAEHLLCDFRLVESRTSNNRANAARKRWQDPEYRQSQVEKMQRGRRFKKTESN